MSRKKRNSGDVLHKLQPLVERYLNGRDDVVAEINELFEEGNEAEGQQKAAEFSKDLEEGFKNIRKVKTTKDTKGIKIHIQAALKNYIEGYRLVSKGKYDFAEKQNKKAEANFEKFQAALDRFMQIYGGGS